MTVKGAKIIQPGEVNIMNLPPEQKLNVLLEMVLRINTQLGTFAQTFYNTQPCGQCGVIPPSLILCSECQAKQAAATLDS